MQTQLGAPSRPCPPRQEASLYRTVSVFFFLYTSGKHTGDQTNAIVSFPTKKEAITPFSGVLCQAVQYLTAAQEFKTHPSLHLFKGCLLAISEFPTYHSLAGNVRSQGKHSLALRKGQPPSAGTEVGACTQAEGRGHSLPRENPESPARTAARGAGEVTASPGSPGGAVKRCTAVCGTSDASDGRRRLAGGQN